MSLCVMTEPVCSLWVRGCPQGRVGTGLGGQGSLQGQWEPSKGSRLPTGLLDGSGSPWSPQTGTLASREPGGAIPWGHHWRSAGLPPPAAAPGPGNPVLRGGEPRGGRLLSQMRGACVSHLILSHLHDWSDLITRERTYLVNVISDLY